jgi:DNA repair exonuclease SbcCD ATPase subunit
MELLLTNFRCWESKCLSIPSSGICLINGKSGKGKSSILNSILYAVTGKIKNITTINKKNTKVTLKIDNISITRSKGPNKLIVEKEGKIYENDDAQSIINSIFGNEFSNTSYIDQENVYSFVFLSPSEKMEFLEKLLLYNYDIEKIKDKIKIEISKTKTDYTTEESKINTLESFILKEDIKEDFIIEKVKITTSNYEKTYDKLKSNKEISEKNIKAIKLKIKKLEDEQFSFIKYKEILSNIKILKENGIFLEFKDHYQNINITDEIKSLEDSKNKYNKNKDYIILVNKYDDLTKKYKDLEKYNKDEIEKLKTLIPLENDISRFSRKRMTDLEKCLEIVDKLSLLEEKLDNTLDFSEEIRKETETYEKYKDLLIKKQKNLSDVQSIYTCPSCKSNLKVNNNKLVLDNIKNDIDIDKLKEEISILKIDITKSENTLSSLRKQQTIHQQNDEEYNSLFDHLDLLRGNIECDKDEIKKEIEIIRHYLEISKQIEDIINDRLLKDVKKDMNLLLEKLKYHTNTENEDKDIKDIKDEEEYIKCIDKISKLKQFISIDSNIKKLEKELPENYSIDSNKSYKDLILEERDRLELYTTKNDIYKKYIEDLEKWNKIQTIKKSIDESSKNKQYLSDKLRCLVKLRDHVKNAEQKCISDFIDSLNQHSSIYIEQFFPDEDIKVELKTTQETKSTGKEKVCLNFELSYRQINGDLSYLSGGERDRVNLAFTLAFSEIINNRILLLDECISSLDAETTNVVLENLKEKYKGKLIILVSHQANLGFFDKVIDI